MLLKQRGTPSRVAFGYHCERLGEGHDRVSQQDFADAGFLLASDRDDQSSELASILQSVGEVDTISTADIPEQPAGDLSGIVVDINLRSPESVQRVRNKLRAEAYREMPRLFVLADALHHGSMQAWALGATDTISRPFDAEGILQRIRAAFPDSEDSTRPTAARR